MVALVLVAGLAAYANSFGGVFVHDDEPSIVENRNVRSLWPLTRAMSAPLDLTVSGRPVASLSFALNYAAATDRGDVWGYHAVNLAIHILAALTLFGVVRRTLDVAARRESRVTDHEVRLTAFGKPSAVKKPDATNAAAGVGVALTIALIWLVHPLQTGSVTYIVQRVESLMGLFYLLTLYCAIRSLQDADASRTLNRTFAGAVWPAAAILSCALGMATKEVMVTAPLMVVLWDFVFARERMWRRRWWLYAGLAATWAILATLVAGGDRSHSVGFGFAAWPWWTYLATQAAVVAHYLRLAIVPDPLVLDYDWRPVRSAIEAAPQAVLLLASIALTIRAVVRRRPIGFAGAWLFVILAPTSSVLPIVTEVAAEHRMYLPLAAVIAIAVVSAFRVMSRRVPRVVLGMTAAAVVAVFAFLTDARNQEYGSKERIWADTVAKRPRNARARTNFATLLIARGQYHDAETHLRVAVAEQPDLAEAQADLGVALCAQRAFDEGIAHLRRAIAIEPTYAAAHQNLGEAYASKGDLASAVVHYLAALEQRPEDVTLLNRAAWILATADDEGVRSGRRAMELAERAVTISRRQNVESLDTLAAAYAEVGRFERAAEVGAEALARARGTNDAMVPELEERLALYRASRPFRLPKT